MTEEFLKHFYKDLSVYFPKEMTFEIFKKKADESWEECHGEH